MQSERTNEEPRKQNRIQNTNQHLFNDLNSELSSECAGVLAISLVDNATMVHSIAVAWLRYMSIQLQVNRFEK